MLLRNRAVLLSSVLMSLAGFTSAFGAIIGGPTYNQGSGVGALDPTITLYPGDPIAGAFAVGTAVKYDAGGQNRGTRAYAWRTSGAAPIELGILSTNFDSPYGYSTASAAGVNASGVATGSVSKYVGSAIFGPRAVRWAADGTVTELAVPTLASNGYGESHGFAINTDGTIVGNARRYVGSADLGTRAVRWNAGGTAATQLGHIGTRLDGATEVSAFAINPAGTAVGFGVKYDAAGTNFLGNRPSRWAAGTTAAIELGTLGQSANGFAQGRAIAINAGGVAVGESDGYDANRQNRGTRPARWEATGIAATPLPGLGMNTSGSFNGRAYNINDAGTAVGYTEKYTSDHVALGNRAVRWDASGTRVEELGNLGLNSGGGTASFAQAINNVGIAVGYAYAYDRDGEALGSRAVAWGADGVALDLNTLLAPDSGWTLTSAAGISEDNWVVGIGAFDPDGPGIGQAAYDRMFLIQVPEPSIVTLMAVGGLMLGRRRR